jgi:hypothetical protein
MDEKTKKSVMDLRLLKQKLRGFRTAWERLSDDGYCDGAGGMEYHRVREEFISAGGARNIDAFITRRT